MLVIMLLLHRDDMNINVYFAVQLSISTTWNRCSQRLLQLTSVGLWCLTKHFAFTFTCILGAANEYMKLCGRGSQMITYILCTIVYTSCSGVPSGVMRACQEQSRTVRVVFTCVQLLKVICKSWQLVLLMVIAALVCVPQALERPSNHTSTLDTRHWCWQFCSRLKTQLFVYGSAMGSASWLFRLIERAI